SPAAHDRSPGPPRPTTSRSSSTPTPFAAVAPSSRTSTCCAGSTIRRRPPAISTRPGSPSRSAGRSPVRDAARDAPAGGSAPAASRSSRPTTSTSAHDSPSRTSTAPGGPSSTAAPRRRLRYHRRPHRRDRRSRRGLPPRASRLREMRSPAVLPTRIRRPSDLRRHVRTRVTAAPRSVSRPLDRQRPAAPVHGEVLQSVLPRPEPAHRAAGQQRDVPGAQRLLAVLRREHALAAHHVHERVHLGADVGGDLLPGGQSDQVGVQLALGHGDGPDGAAARLLGLLRGVGEDRHVAPFLLSMSPPNVPRP